MTMVTEAVIAFALALLTLGTATGTALAQTPTTSPAPEGKTATESKPDDIQGDITGDIELTRAAIQVRRQAIVTAAMDLEPKEADLFWPLYREYRTAMAQVNDRLVRLLVGYLESYESLSDAAATKMLNEYLSIERARTSVKTKYVPRFTKMIPSRKVARFFQVDNKLDAVINADLAYLIPLAR